LPVRPSSPFLPVASVSLVLVVLLAIVRLEPPGRVVALDALGEVAPIDAAVSPSHVLRPIPPDAGHGAAPWSRAARLWYPGVVFKLVNFDHLS
jgi:hypothetical protein